MPTLVGAQGGPEEGVGLPGLPGNERRPRPAAPRAKGAATPSAATRNEESPTRRMSRIVDSSPSLEQERARHADPGKQIERRDRSRSRRVRPQRPQGKGCRGEPPPGATPSAGGWPSTTSQVSHELRGHEDQRRGTRRSGMEVARRRRHAVAGNRRTAARNGVPRNRRFSQGASPPFIEMACGCRIPTGGADPPPIRRAPSIIVVHDVPLQIPLSA